MKNQHRKELGSKAGFLPGYDCTGLRNVVQNLSFCAAAELTSCRPWGHPNTTIFLPTTREDVSPAHARESWKLPELWPAGSQLLVMHSPCLSSPMSESFSWYQICTSPTMVSLLSPADRSQEKSYAPSFCQMCQAEVRLHLSPGV